MLAGLDRRFVVAAFLGGPLLYLALRGLSASLGPLQGWAVGLVLYWIGLAATLLAWGAPGRIAEWVRPARQGRLMTLLLALPPIGLGAVAMLALGDVILPIHVVLGCAMGAVANGALEELVWRGAMAPEGEPQPLAVSLVFFGSSHFAWAGAIGLSVPGGTLGTVAGAFALGGLWTASRLLSGSLGAAILSHVLVSLFAFVIVAARNWSPV